MTVKSTADAYRNITWLHLRCGDHVHTSDDPRHVGRVVAIFGSATIKVRWDDNGWTSEESAADLVKVKGMTE